MASFHSLQYCWSQFGELPRKPDHALLRFCNCHSCQYTTLSMKHEFLFSFRFGTMLICSLNFFRLETFSFSLIESFYSLFNSIKFLSIPCFVDQIKMFQLTTINKTDLSSVGRAEDCSGVCNP